MGTLPMIGVFVLLGVFMYFFMIRPARKQQQAQQKMMDSIEVGSRIMTGSGIYGTVRHLGEKQAVIEISPGVDMTILRAAVRSVVTNEEEEFEYSDEAGEPDQMPGTTDMGVYEQDVNAAFAPPSDTEPVEEPEASPTDEDTDTDTTKK